MRSSTHLATTAGLILLLASLCPAGPRGERQQFPSDWTLHGHTHAVTSLAFLPDSRRFVSGSLDKTVRLWDAEEGALLHTFEGHEAGVRGVSVSADGKLIASAGDDRTVRVWEVKTGDQVGLLQGHPGRVYAVAFLPDGSVLSAGEDGLRRWDVTTEKLLWKLPVDFGVRRLSVSRDGKRAAFTGDDGRTHVWDLQARRKVGTFGLPQTHIPLTVALSPDGTELFCDTEVTRWDVETGKRLPALKGMDRSESTSFTADGTRVIAVAVNSVRVWDRKTGAVIAALRTDYRQTSRTAAFSPDGKTIVIGGGGKGLGDELEPAENNWVEVYPMPAPRAEAPGPVAGKISWEVIPARVRKRDGSELPLSEAKWEPGSGHPGDLHARALTDKLDALWHYGVVLLHKEPGLLEEVLVDENAGFFDVRWDGANIWVADNRFGLRILDKSGKILATVREPDLPRASNGLVLHPLAPNKVLAAGSAGMQRGVGDEAPPIAWVAVIEYLPEKRSANVRKLFTDAQLPPVPRRGQQNSEPGFAPRWIAGPEGAPCVFVGCRNFQDGGQDFLRVDLRTLAVTVAKRVASGAMRERFVDPNDGPPLWVDARRCLNVDPDGTYSSILGDGESAPGARVCAVKPGRVRALLSYGGQVYAPGTQWVRIDPKTFAAEGIGPGLRADGVLIDEAVSYFVSGHFGLAAVSSLDGCFYRISADPAHPLPIRASPVTPINGRREVPAEGVIRVLGDEVFAICGEGILRRSGADRIAALELCLPFRNAGLERIQEYSATRKLHSRLMDDAEERKRVGITDEQRDKLGAILQNNPEPRPDTAQFVALFRAYESAAGQARQRAGADLLSATRTFGQQRKQRQEAYLAAFRAALTPRQWKLLHYEATE